MKNKIFSFHILLAAIGLIVIITSGLFIYFQFVKMAAEGFYAGSFLVILAITGYLFFLKNSSAVSKQRSEKEERTRAMLDAAPLNIVMVDRNFNILDCNQEILRLFDLTDKQEFFENFYNLSPKFQPSGRPSKEWAVENIKKAFDEGYCRFDWVHQKLNGEPLPCEITLVNIKYKGNDAVAAYARDLRETKAVMDKMREADARARIIFDATPFNINLFDNNLNIIYCNQETVYLFGLSDRQEFLDNFYKFSPEYQPCGKLSQKMAVEVGQKAFDEGYNRFEWMHQKLNGELIPCEIILVRIIYKGENALAGYARDLREIKAKDAEVQKANEYTQIMLDATPLSCSLIDRNYRVIDCNKEAEKLFRVSNKEKYIRNFFEFSPPVQLDGEDSQEKAFKFFKETFDKGYTHFEWMHINTAGDIIPCEVILVRVKYKNDYIIAAYTRDLREIKTKEAEAHEAAKQKAEAEAANNAKTNFLARMSHEIRTPMNAILGITEIQLQNELLLPDMEDALSQIYNSGYLLLSIVNDMLDLSKIEAGKLELIPVQYDTASLIHDTAMLNMARYDSKPIQFNLEVDENIPSTLIGDELRIKQILNNMLSNAFKYTNNGSVTMSVNTEADGGLKSGGLKFGESSEEKSEITIIFRISDTGQGMTSEESEKLFTEYMRFNIEANRTTEGTGLGMSITKNLVNMMNGDIFVESEPNKGSVFTVRLPQRVYDNKVLGKKLAENLRGLSAGKPLKTKQSLQIVREYMPYGTVLVVDDVETNLTVAKGLLAPYGLSVSTLQSGIEAINEIKKGAVYDIIFMDHFMPEMDGIMAVKHIRNLGYKNPIIVLTANALTGQEEMFMENGFDGFISKPIDIRHLNAVLNNLIRDKYPQKIVEAARKLKEKLTKKSAFSEMKLSEDTYTAFIRDAEKAAASMESVNTYKYRRDDDIQAYTLSAHAMKGALANIGETELSAFAFKLEDAGRKRDTDALSEETPLFLNELKALTEKIKRKVNDSKNNFHDENQAFLHEKLTAIQEASSAYDRKTSYDLVVELRQKTSSQPVRELLDTINEYLLHSDFDEAARAAEDYKKERLIL